MRITRASAAPSPEGGNDISLTFHWDTDELFGSSEVADMLAWLSGFVGGLAAEIAAATPPRRPSVVEIADEIAKEVEAKLAEPVEPAPFPAPSPDHGHVEPATRSRRKPNPLGDGDAAAAPLAPPSTVGGEAKTSAAGASPSESGLVDPSPRRRRAPAASDTATSASVADTPPSEEAAPLVRRRRAAPSADATPATPASPPETAVSPSRRRRAAPSVPSTEAVEVAPEPPAKETAPTPPVSEPVAPSIPDAELSKAASRGAAALTPKVVQAFIATFLKDDETPCSKVGDIHPDDRRTFLDELAAKIAEAQ